MDAMPNAEDWAAALDLERQGTEWRGTCPLCGFLQFYVGATPDGRAVVGCRRCRNRKLPDERRILFGILLQRFFPERFRKENRPVGTDGPPTGTT